MTAVLKSECDTYGSEPILCSSLKMKLGIFVAPAIQNVLTIPQKRRLQFSYKQLK
jgi:hypothetical protein